MKKWNKKIVLSLNRFFRRLPSENKLPFFTLSFTLAALIVTIVAVQQQQNLIQEAAKKEICDESSESGNSRVVTQGPEVSVHIRREETPPSVVNTGDANVKGQLIVRYKAGKSKYSVGEKVKKRKGKIKRRVDRIQMDVIEVPEGQEAVTLQDIASDPNVMFAEYDHRVSLGSIPNDKEFGKQWALHNTGQTGGTAGADINAPEAWDKTRGKNSVKIAILDSGVDKTHKELQGKVIAEKSFVGGNGVTDNHGHGTAMAGIAAAIGNNNEGISGVCPECSILSGKVIEPGVSQNESTVIEGFSWAIENNANVISISVGGPNKSETFASVIKEAVDKGIVVVAFGGNCGDDTWPQNTCSQKNGIVYPAAYDGVIGVAAVDANGHIASFSNHGANIDVAAPGVDIYSLLPNNQYQQRSGTSEAAPHVAGLAGLLISQGMSGQEAIDKIQNTAEKIAGTGDLWKYGLVNAAAAVGGTATTPVNPNPSQVKPSKEPKASKAPKPSCKPKKKNKGSKVTQSPAKTKTPDKTSKSKGGNSQKNTPCIANPSKTNKNTTGTNPSSGGSGKNGQVNTSQKESTVTTGKINSDETTNTKITVNGKELAGETNINDEVGTPYQAGEDINTGGQTGGSHKTEITLNKNGEDQTVDKSGSSNTQQISSGGKNNQISGGKTGAKTGAPCGTEDQKNNKGTKKTDSDKKKKDDKKDGKTNKQPSLLCRLAPFLGSCKNDSQNNEKKKEDDRKKKDAEEQKRKNDEQKKQDEAKKKADDSKKKNVKGAATESDIILRNTIQTCIGEHNPTVCTADMTAVADLSEDGKVDQKDYTLYLRGER